MEIACLQASGSVSFVLPHIAGSEVRMTVHLPTDTPRQAQAGAANAPRRTVTTATLSFAEPLEMPKLEGWLQSLITTYGSALIRVKGIVKVRGEDRPVAIHGTRHVFHATRFLDSWPPELAYSTLFCAIDDVEGSELHDSAVAAGLPVLMTETA
jgi:G3E family GTPase